MSFDLSVYAPEFPNDLAVTWPRALAKHGLVVEVCPGFTIGGWSGGFLPFKLSVEANAFPHASRYGTDPLLAGFEILFSGVAEEDRETLAREDSNSIAEIYRNSRLQAYLTTAMGRSVADLRLQCFAAATLSHIAGGLVFDGQQGKSFTGDAVFTNAAREAQLYEGEGSDGEAWDLVPFPGWEAIGTI